MRRIPTIQNEQDIKLSNHDTKELEHLIKAMKRTQMIQMLILSLMAIVSLISIFSKIDQTLAIVLIVVFSLSLGWCIFHLRSIALKIRDLLKSEV